LFVALAGKPQRLLPAIVEAEDGAFGLLRGVGRECPQRPAGSTFEMRVGAFLPVLVIIFGPLEGEALAGPAAEAGDVPEIHIHLRLSVDYPFRDHLADAGALVQAAHHAAGAEIVLQLGVRPKQRSKVGRKDHRPVDDALDAGLAESWHAVHRHFEIAIHARQVVGQQLVAEIERRAVEGPVMAGAS